MPKRTQSRDEEAVQRFVDHMATTFVQWGFPRMAARVLFTMMCSEEESLTAADLSERLGVSPAAISGSVRLLIQLGLLTRQHERGSRRGRYRLRNDAWYATTAAQQELLMSLANESNEGVAALGGPATRAGGRGADMRDFFVFYYNEMDGLLEKWQKGR
jgi:DNA-binding transcriptional regulator GbsR (MarR family)